MATAKTKARAAKLIHLAAGGDEPKIDKDNYRSDLIGALNWYNINSDDKKRRKYVNDYLTTHNRKALKTIERAKDFDLIQLGAIIRLKQRGEFLEEKELSFIETKINSLLQRYGDGVVQSTSQLTGQPKKVVAPTNVVSIQDRIEESARKHAAEIDGAIDEFVIAKGKDFDFSTKNYLLANQISGAVSKRIGEFYKSTADELREAIEGKDPQLVEGYSNFTKRELKKFAEFVDQIILDCQQVVQVTKINRAPRKRKPVPASKQVARVKYLKEFVDLKLKSVKPEDILTSTEVWVYNTKSRRVGVYKSIGGEFTVKGTTLLGFDVAESKCWTLRKPEQFFSGLSVGKRALNAAIKKLTTKPGALNGRLNEETIILGAF